MPEISSIGKTASTDEDSAGGIEPLGRGRSAQESPPSHQASLSPGIDSEPSKLSIFELTTRFDIPAIDLRTLQGVPSAKKSGPRIVSYGLGAGVSCSVSLHQVDDHVDGCPRGTKVALKKYRDVTGDANSNKRLHRLLWQELKVFCHPLLTSHANICKLRFIGWEETTMVPVLALELAAYGTLDDCLQDLRSYHPALTKAHLSLDIALGLEALHACGLVHGDMKPSNIIVQEHPSRSAIAKLSDFSGVGPAETYGEGYTFGTPEWQSPEALIQHRHIDWQLGDVYSFAMVIATIWSNKGFIPSGGSFIDPTLKYKYGHEHKRVCIDRMKFLPEFDEGSILKVAFRETRTLGPGEDEFLIATPIIQNGLRRNPAHRMIMEDVLKTAFQPFCAKHNRLLPSQRPQGVTLPSEYDMYDGWGSLLINSHSYSARSAPFQKMVFRNLLELGASLCNSVDMLPTSKIEDGFQGTQEELLATFHSNTKGLSFSGKNHTLFRFAKVAAELGLSYLVGLGTSVDERLAIEWLSKAAIAGETTSACLFSPLEQSTGAFQNDLLPRRLWAAYGTIVGYRASAECLNALDPVLYEIASGAHQLKRWGPPTVVSQNTTGGNEDAGGGGRQRSSTESLFCAATTGPLDTVIDVLNGGASINAINERRESAIFCATWANQFEIARCLLDRRVDVTIISADRRTVIHCLSFMDDNHAAELAPLYVNGRAKLDILASEQPEANDDIFCLGSGIPLQWAAMKQKPLLFEALLQCHIRTHSRLDQLRYLQLLQTLAMSNEHGMLDMTIRTTGLSAIPFNSPPVYSSLLRLALDLNKIEVLRRRYMHRANFRHAKRETLSVLLRAGADPIQPGLSTNDKDCLAIAVHTNDLTALQMFVEHLESRGMDVETLLADPERFGGYNALHKSIDTDSRDVFIFLVEKYTSLIHLEGLYRRKPLHAAATQESPEYVRELLRKGASPYDRTNDRSTPFNLALVKSPSLETAKLLAESCEDMDRILGPDEKTGFTAFGRVLNGLVNYRMGFGLERLRYLVDTFGRPSIFACVPARTTVFHSILLQKTPLTDSAQLALESVVLRFLLRVFAEEVDFADRSGLSPLHIAASHAHKPAVEILLEHGANVNLEVAAPKSEGITAREPFEGTSSRGHTPLSLAVVCQSKGPPDWVRQGGLREIEQWERNMEDIIRLLLSHGAKTGGPSLETSLLTSIAAGLQNTVITKPGGKSDSERKTGEWPKRLPRDGLVNDKDMVEVINENGLTQWTRRKGMQMIQDLLGAIDGPKGGVRTGNAWEEPPPPPVGEVEKLRTECAELKRLMAIEISSLGD